MTKSEAYFTSHRLLRSFYTDTDVVQLSRRLLGQYLVTRFESKLSAGRIIETEAYRGPEDRASHAVLIRAMQPVLGLELMLC